jgi:hypothetical protein
LKKLKNMKSRQSVEKTSDNNSISYISCSFF